MVTEWTGETACALQAAMLMSNESFASHLKIGVRTVASWHEDPKIRPNSSTQQRLDATLERASAVVKERFAQHLPASQRTGSDAGDATAEAEHRLNTDPSIGAALEWLDEHAGWDAGTARRRVASRMTELDERELRDRGNQRGRVTQRQVANALAEYYGDEHQSHGRYAARFGDDEAETSILTRAEWLDLECALNATNDRLAVVNVDADAGMHLDEEAADRAVQRLAETLTTGVRLIDMPLYQLHEIDVHKGALGGKVGVSHFVSYALTMDLLEGELADALSAGSPAQQGTLPLRDRNLPDLASVVDVQNRLCAGGTLALCAIARPSDPIRGEADYLLLIQERSGHVVNAARRLAVIPKGFHQPLTDFRAEAQIGATLRREMEEELFGRDDIDNTVSDRRRADPMHPSRLSEPMRWLMDEPDRMRMECTGFGLNLVSGNYEFASLIVIEDDEFWRRYGGQVEANWESSGLRQYSSLDGALLAELVREVGWSNEGLFALLQGFRRLKQIGGERVNLPAVEWEIR